MIEIFLVILKKIIINMEVKMKKLALIVCALMLISMVACANDDGNLDNNGNNGNNVGDEIEDDIDDALDDNNNGANADNGDVADEQTLTDQPKVMEEK